MCTACVCTACVCTACVCCVLRVCVCTACVCAFCVCILHTRLCLHLRMRIYTAYVVVYEGSVLCVCVCVCILRMYTEYWAMPSRVCVGGCNMTLHLRMCM